MQPFIPVISYVTDAPYFWLSMGATTGVAMLIGAITYDGGMSQAVKGIVSVLSYIFFIIQVSITRLMHTFLMSTKTMADTDYPMAFAGIVTMLFVSVFWISGVLLGVYVSSFYHKREV